MQLKSTKYNILYSKPIFNLICLYFFRKAKGFKITSFKSLKSGPNWFYNQGIQVSTTVFFVIYILLFHASFSKLTESKEQVEQKHVHLLQILDSERQAKWFYAQQTEELALEVKQLKTEVTSV